MHEHNRDHAHIPMQFTPQANGALQQHRTPQTRVQARPLRRRTLSTVDMLFALSWVTALLIGVFFYGPIVFALAFAVLVFFFALGVLVALCIRAAA